jgi:hypothetical protein
LWVFAAFPRLDSVDGVERHAAISQERGTDDYDFFLRSRQLADNSFAGNQVDDPRLVGSYLLHVPSLNINDSGSSSLDPNDLFRHGDDAPADAVSVRKKHVIRVRRLRPSGQKSDQKEEGENCRMIAHAELLGRSMTAHDFY